jgi:hypothetical protein
LETLLSYYDHVDHQAVSVQAAVLEEVTYSKVIGTGAKQTFARAKSFAKWLADKAAIRNNIDDTPPKGTAELVMDRANYWESAPFSGAKEFVLNTLSARLQVPSSDLALLSTRLIEEAAAGYGISEDLLLSQQAEAVAKKYLEDCIEGVREQLRKQGDDEIRVTERIMADQIAGMTPSQRLEIQKALNLPTLSASALRSIFLNSGIPLASIAALQAGGFGAYLALTTVMHAVFTSMLGITLPFAAYTTATSALSILTGPAGVLLSLSIGLLGYFWGQRKIERSQYAMIVWTSVMHAGRPLIPQTSLLPSVRTNKLLTDGTGSITDAPNGELEDFRALISEREERKLASRALKSAQESSEHAQKRIESLEERLRKAEDRLASSSASRSVESNLNTALESLIQSQQQSIEALRREREIAKRDAEELQNKLNKQESKTIEAEARYSSRLERRVKEIQALWAIHYPKVDFKQQPLRWAAEQDFSGRVEIERALKELTDAPDPVKLSRSRMHATHEHHSVSQYLRELNAGCFMWSTTVVSKFVRCAKRKTVDVLF